MYFSKLYSSTRFFLGLGSFLVIVHWVLSAMLSNCHDVTYVQHHKRTIITSPKYQVLHLLSYPGASLAGVPLPLSWPGWGVPPPPPHLDLARVPPIWTWPGYPPSGLDQGTPPPHLLWDGDGVLLLGVDRKTPAKTVPSRRTTYAGGN